jgi:hypothetical protein
MEGVASDWLVVASANQTSAVRLFSEHEHERIAARASTSGRFPDIGQVREHLFQCLGRWQAAEGALEGHWGREGHWYRGEREGSYLNIGARGVVSLHWTKWQLAVRQDCGIV